MNPSVNGVSILYRDEPRILAAGDSGDVRAVTPEEERRLAVARPVHPAAFDAYLKGRFHWYNLSREYLETALQYFQPALEKDPGCAQAWAGISAVWGALSDSGFLAPHAAIPKAKAAAFKALEWDDSLAGVRVQIANRLFASDRDWAGAEAEFRRAIAANPNSAEALFFYADFLISMGRAEEALLQRMNYPAAVNA